MGKSRSNSYRSTVVHCLTAIVVFCILPILESRSDTSAIVSYSYDELGRLTRETFEDGTTVTFTYDEVGNRLTRQVIAGAGAGITVASPAGGETWEAGAGKIIQWTYRGNPGSSVNIELLKGEAPNSVITPSAPTGDGTTGSYTWNIPSGQTPANDYKIRVTSTENTQYSDSSKDDFTIAPPTSGITLTSPSGGEQWTAGTTRTIKWTYSEDTGPSVRIELLKSGVLNEVISPIASIGTGGTGSYNWQIPSGQAVGNDYRIRVTNITNGAFQGTSNSNFAIVNTGITLTSPNDGESLQAGTTRTISWTAFGAPGSSVRIELLKGGSVDRTITAGAPLGILNSGSYQGSYDWAIPAGQASGADYRIRITSTTNSAYLDTSDQDFTILPTSITVTFPYPGQSIPAGTSETIRWYFKGNPGPSVKIELLKGGVLDSIITPSTPIGDIVGSYSWTVPSTQPAGSDYRVRITSTSDSAYTDISDNELTIVAAGLTVDRPNGGESLTAGTIQWITWYYVGNPGPSVKIELLKGGMVESVITPLQLRIITKDLMWPEGGEPGGVPGSKVPIGIDGSGSCVWAIPVDQTAGADYRIRIRSTGNGSFADTSDGDFAILPPAITLVSPNSGESLQAGAIQTIKWDYSGNPGSSVKIELLKGGVLDSVIVSNASIGTNGHGSYEWGVPAGQPVGADYRIRITSTSNSSYLDTSDRDFAIVPPSISISLPDGGEMWQAGAIHAVRWSFSGNPGTSVKLELLKGGTLESTIAASVPVGIKDAQGNCKGSYDWTIPADQASGSAYRVRVTSTSNSAYTDTSESDFEILPTSITVTSPYEGDIWITGTTQTIGWEYHGDPGSSLKIELLKGGVLSSTIAESTPLNVINGFGCYSWTIPTVQASGSDYRIRITSTANSAYTGTSDFEFSIASTGVVLTYPNGGDTWAAGATLCIEWSYFGDPGASVRIELLKGGILSSTISAETPLGRWGQGFCYWTIPLTQPSGSDYRVRITSTSNSTFTDVSDSDFAIAPASITLASPNGGEIWQPGSTRLIDWRYQGNPGGSVRIELMKGDLLDSAISSGTPMGSDGYGCYSWTIPSALPLGSDYRVRVTSTGNGAYSDTSDNNFSIRIPNAIVVTSPGGGEGWTAGSSQTLRWTYSGNPGSTVEIKLLKGGILNRTIASNASIGSEGTGSYTWLVPSDQTSGTDYRVQVTTALTSDTSDSDFTITDSSVLTVAYPVGGEMIQAGTTQNVKWTYTGNPGSSVKIELLKGGVLYDTIASQVPVGTGGNGTYSWFIHYGYTAGNDFNIRISSGSLYDTSNGDFWIVSKLVTVTSPNACAWGAGSTQTIAWTYQGNPGPSVNIELLKGGVLNSTIASIVSIGSGGRGSYSWAIPISQPPGYDYSIRVVSTSNSEYEDTSDDGFAIMPQEIRVASPNGNEGMYPGETQTILWSYYGDPGCPVKIELLKGGVLESVISASSPIGMDSTGSYNWTIPATQALGTDYRVRITSTSNSGFSDTSDQDFSVLPGYIRLSGPRGGEKWPAGTVQWICWYYGGTPGSSVKIELLKGGLIDSVIATNIPTGSDGSGAYLWVIPDGRQAGSDYRVRVTSTSNGAYQDISDGDFAILAPSNTLISPNGGELWRAGTTRTIGWRYSGNPGPSVLIQLLQGNVLYSNIATVPIGIEGAGSYDWPIYAGLPAATNYRVRITGTTDSAFTDTSDRDFAVSAPASVMMLRSPNGGETLQAGTTQRIVWSYPDDSGPSVRIELLKGGAVENIIEANAPIGVGSAGSYYWAIPVGLPAGADYKIRITSTSSGACSDASDGDFTILPTSITLLKPNGGQSWQAGTTQLISWSFQGDPGPAVKIELLKGGVLESTITSSTPIGMLGNEGWRGQYLWTIPASQSAGSEYRIRVVSTTDSAFSDTSERDFTIRPTIITVVEPHGGESWEAGTLYKIQWSFAGDPGPSVKIELLKEGVFHRTIIAQVPVGVSSGGSYHWTIPVFQEGGSEYTIRVTSTSNGAFTDTSDSNLTIIPTGIAVRSPNGGENLAAGTIQKIRWDYRGDPGASVGIELLRGGVLESTIIDDAPIGINGFGSYIWAIPTPQTSGSDYTIRLTSSSMIAYTDTSDAGFTIAPVGITVTAPNGLEQWGAGTEQLIKWTYQGGPGPSVKIELFKGGDLHSTIASIASIGSGGSGFFWDIPADVIPGTDYRVKITSISNTFVSDTSNGDFTVLPIAVIVSSPNGGEVLHAGASLTIAWTYTGDPGPSVRIELLKGGVLSDLIIARAQTGSGGNGSFTWTIPSSLASGSDYQIRITSATDDRCTDTSNGNFTIQP